MEIVAKLGKLVAVHAENDAASDEAVRSISQGKTTARDYLQSRGPEYENRGIADAIGLAAVTGCPLHIVHVSQPMGVDLVREARSRGVNVTCETCPHYLLLSEPDLLKIGPNAKCAPPLRSEEMVRDMWELLRNGAVDFMASDHSPSPESMKGSSNFFEVWGGIAGVQSTLAALLSHWPRLPRELIAQLIAANVAARFGIPHKGRIAAGYDADVTLVDEHGSYQLTRELLLDRHKLSPYVGRSFRGIVKRTIVRGQTVFIDGRIVSRPIGQLVKPEAA
jgi:allantoinase